MVRAGIFAPLAAAALLAASADAFTLTITNNCGSSIDVYLRQGSVYTDSFDTLATGASTEKTIEKGFEGHFRNGSSTSATLVEFSTGGDMDFVWHDISIIPPELTAGHEYCTSLDDCKANSATGIGFNTAVRLTPLANTNGDSCRELDCLKDYCEDAYLYPTDDLKTHACALETDFELTFCPDGSSVSTSSPTPAPVTESPVVTAAPTAAPATTTAAPAETTASPVATTATPAETTAAPVATTAAPAETTAAPVATTAAPASTDDTDAYDDTTGNDADSSSTPAPTAAATDAATTAPKSKFCH